MKCPACNHPDTKVIDSRLSGDGDSIRRRRECLECEKRFTTYEYIEQVPLMVVKRDSSRQPFDRKKIISGLIKACEKRPVSMDKVEEITTQIERELQKKYDREVNSKDIGELVMAKLMGVDEVAYVRFASVYRQFRDVNQFMSELQHVFNKERKKTPEHWKAKVKNKRKFRSR